MERDPREQQRSDAERRPDERPGQLDPEVERLYADDDFDLDDDDSDDEALDDDDLEEV